MPVASNYSLFVAEQLRHVRNIVLEQEFPEYLMADGRLVPIPAPGSPDAIPIGAMTYVYYLQTMVGEAKIISNPGDDLPVADLFVEARTGRVFDIGDSYRYSDMDLEHARFAGVNLTAAKANAAKKAMMIKLDKVGYLGDSAYGLLGLCNQPNVPTFSVPNDGTGSSTTWASKTPQQILRDLRDFSAIISNTTNLVETPDTLLLPTLEYFRIAQSFIDTNATTTILEAFLKTNTVTGGINNVQPIPYLNGAGTNGSNMMVAYTRRADKLKFHVPMPFTPKAPQEVNLHYKVPCRMKTGGVEVTYPLSLAYGYGI